MPAEPWRLDRFLEHFDDWTARELPSNDLRVIVLMWIQSRMDDPYQGARREPGFDNLWFAAVPDSQHGDGRAVTCSFRILEREHVVRCDQLAGLSWPF